MVAAVNNNHVLPTSWSHVGASEVSISVCPQSPHAISFPCLDIPPVVQKGTNGFHHDDVPARAARAVADFFHGPNSTSLCIIVILVKKG